MVNISCIHIEHFAHGSEVVMDILAMLCKNIILLILFEEMFDITPFFLQRNCSFL